MRVVRVGESVGRRAGEPMSHAGGSRPDGRVLGDLLHALSVDLGDSCDIRRKIQYREDETKEHIARMMN